MNLLVALAWMLALAVFGVRILSRGARFLDGVERLVYGSVLGLVLGTLAVLFVAWNAGLSVPLVIGVGAVAAVAAWRIAPGVPGNTETASTASRGSGVGTIAVLVALGALWSFLWLHAFRSDDSGWWTSQVNLWGDWSLHFGDAASFAYGDNFPPRHPRIAGQPFVYHYLAALTAACWMELGVDPRIALTLQSFILCLITTLSVFAFARRLTADRSAAALAVVLFLLGGGIAWAAELRREAAHGGLTWTGWDSGALGADGFQWPNVVWAFLQPQRSTLYGIPLALLVLTLVLEAARTRQRGLLLLAGLVTGLLPFSNMGALLSLALMTPLLMLLLPSRGWLGFAAAAAVTVLPQVLLMQAGGGEAHAGSGMLRSIRWQPGWLSANAQWPLFWLRNLGPLLPLAVWALWQWKSEAVTRRLLGAMLMLFVFGNLVVFQPWDWDNTKILLYAYVAICILASALLVGAWRSGSVLARAGCVLALLVSLLSGARLQLHVLAGKDRFTFLTREELGLAEWARAQTPAHTRFLVGLQHNHPIPVLSGRPVIMSYEGWLWSQGHDPEPYERDVRAMYALGPGADSLLDHYGVGRVVIGPDEVRRFDPDTLAWRARFRSVYRSARYEVFATGKDEAR